MRCFYCGNEHEYKCPMVSAYELEPDTGKIKRIEFVTFVDLMGEAANPLTNIPPVRVKSAATTA